MKKFFTERKLAAAIVILLFCFFLAPQQGRAQGYIGMSTQIGGGDLEAYPQIKVLNGYTYMYSYTASSNYPVSSGAFQTVSGGGNDLAFTKINPDGTIAYSTYLGGSDYESTPSYPGDHFVVTSTGEVYLLGETFTTVGNYPVTITTGPGTAHAAGSAALVVTKLNANGSIAYSRYIANTAASGTLNGTGIAVYNGEAYITAVTSANTFPVVGNTTVFQGTVGLSENRTLTRLNASGSIVYSAYTSRRTIGDPVERLIVDGTGVYIAGKPTSFFTAPFSVTSGALGAVYVMKLDFNCNRIWNVQLGDNDFNNKLADVRVDNGNVYIAGRTVTGIYPSTNGSVYNGMGDVYIAKLSSSGSIAYYGFIGGTGTDTPQYSTLAVENNIAYLVFYTASADLPVTDGTSLSDVSGMALFKIGAAGNTISGTYFGGKGNPGGIQVLNGEVYVQAISSGPAYPVTNTSTSAGANDLVFTKLGTANNVIFSTYVGPVNGIGAGINYNTLALDNGFVYVSGTTPSSSYPVTLNPSYAGGSDDNVVTRLVICPSGYNTGTGAVVPASQTACKNGLGQTIVADSIYFNGAMPLIYRNGVASPQDGTGGIKYQWQRADAAAGPWVNIPDGILKNYLPSVGSTNQYYRRLTTNSCGDNLATSNVAAVLAGANTAAVVNAGGVVRTCPNTAVTLGGSPTATGGASPYTYTWDNGLAAVSNPSVTVTKPTVFTLKVTDANGCQTLAQTVVSADSANAGSDVSYCAGSGGVRIGAAPIAGLTGVTYSWSPAAGLSCTTCAQPVATPSAQTNYTLTVTLPVTGGGTCVTTDVVTVTPVAAPVTANFAGADVITCSGSGTALGTTAESGFTYTWSPGTYLSSNSTSTTTYQPGNLTNPNPNPVTYYLTASKSGCYFVDSVKAASITANAGLDGCGPRLLGTADITPGVNETYSWTIVSGPGTFVGGAVTSSLAQPSVGSLSGPTVFRLNVTYTIGGVTRTCTDDVTVGGCGCQVLITPFGPHSCPSFNLSGGANTTGLTATPQSGDPSQYSYSWLPAAGLSSTTGQTVYLTDNVARTYTCTITSLLDPSFTCGNTYSVNNPAWALPVFAARHVATCPGTGVSIGQTNVANYNYLWSASTSLSSTTSSNPTATVTTDSNFPVKVTDVGSGCYILDTAVVAVQSTTANAGPDWYVCDNAIVQLGTPAQPNTTYSWSPAAPWQNGTNAASAQPQVLVAANLTFTVTATNTATGCTSSDQVQIFVNNIPSIANAPDVSACKNVGVQIGSPALPGVAYSWSPATGLSNPSIAQPVATPASTTTYTVTATFPGSCASVATDAVTVTVHDPSFTLAPKSYCPSAGAVSLTGAPAGMSSYSWSPASLVSNAVIATPSTLNPAPSSATTFALTVQDAFGCSATANMVITPTVAAPIAGNNITMCLGTSTQLGSASNPAGATYSWSPATGLSSAASPNPVFTPTAAGTTVFTVTKTEAGCTSTATVQVTVNSFVVPALTSPSVCVGSCVQIGTTAVNGAVYSWSPAAGLSNANIANPVACVSSTTAYALTAIGPNGCPAKATVVVGVSSSPAPTINVSPVSVCQGSSASFNAVVSPAGSYNYLWTPNDGRLSNVLVYNPSILTGSTGTSSYSVVVTNTANGCAGSAAATVNVTSCVVPVKLEGFTATKQGTGVLLNWVVGAEMNVSHYEVEFSTGGNNYQRIGNVAAANMHNYSLIHKDPVTGSNYYRLRIVDNDGAFSYSDVRKVVFDKAGSVSLYPNPAYAGSITVAVAGSMVNRAATMSVFAADGRLMLTKSIGKLTASQPVDISRLMAGKYILHITTDVEVINKVFEVVH